ncbi:hypothetical protein VTJ49DRAFT_6642 [Mycothermus thermophilus]|uniref:RRM domain-containing protein n=1 Tax=Humicola insolens TaxID=85995 RepID=A0ABR3VK42_HUMIN
MDSAMRDDDRSRTRSRSPTPRSRRSRSPSMDRRRSDSRDDYSRSPARNGRGRSWSRGRTIRVAEATVVLGAGLIVVERLTKNVNEDHLYEIFGEYGEIDDLDLPISRVNGLNRGTAYILYYNEADAQAAITHMHEAQLDGNIIHVSIVLPRRKMSPPPPVARRGPRGPPANVRSVLSGAAGGSGRGSRFAQRSDVYRPRSISRSRSRSPAPSGSRRYRSRSASYASRSPSRSPRRDRRGYGRRRSPSRDSHDSYGRRSRSRSRSRDRR